MVAKLDFGGLKSKKTAASKKDFPMFPDDEGKIAPMVSELAKSDKQIKALTGTKTAIQKDLKEIVRPFHFKTNHGKSVTTNAVSVFGVDGEEILVTFKDAYARLGDLEKVIEIIGEELTAKFFEQVFVLAIKSEEIPRAKLQDVINDVMAVMQKHECLDAVSADPYFAPTDEFATARHRVLTPEQNIALESMDPEKGFQTVAVAPARGRK